MSTKREQKAASFYKKLLRLLQNKNIPFMVGGTYAFSAYTSIYRTTKDLDLFTTPEIYPLLLRTARDVGYDTQLLDEDWIAKIHKENHTADVIFAEKNGLNKVTLSWFERSPIYRVLGLDVHLMPLEEMIKSKAFIQNKNRYDGPDVVHLILRQGNVLDWRFLLALMDPHWEVLFAHLLNFIFVYPGDKEIIPRWLMDTLIKRLEQLLHEQKHMSAVTRGLLYSTQYKESIERWGYQDISRLKVGFEGE